MRFDLSKTVVVFDLDDTLYPEVDYVESGARHVCFNLKQLCGNDPLVAVLDVISKDPKADWLTVACSLAGLPMAAKESLLWMYRLHLPEIRLSKECESLLGRIRELASAVAILTDGRCVTQMQKLRALGLSNMPVYISEVYGATKPNPDRFIAIEGHYPAPNYIYVADNVGKDFIGCKARGWIGVCMVNKGRNIHPSSGEHVPESACPHFWVSSWEELAELLGCA